MATSSLPSAFDAHSNPHILPPMFYSAIQDYPPGFCTFNANLQQQSSEACDYNKLSVLEDEEERKVGNSKDDNSVEESGDEEIVHKKRTIFHVVRDDYPPGFGPNQQIIDADSQNSEFFDCDDTDSSIVPDYPPGFGPDSSNSKHYGFDYAKSSLIHEFCSDDGYNGDDEKEDGKVCRKRKSSDLMEEGGDEFDPKRMMMCFEVCHYPAGFSPCRLLHQHDFEPSDFCGDGEKTNLSSSLLLM